MNRPMLAVLAASIFVVPSAALAADPHAGHAGHAMPAAEPARPASDGAEPQTGADLPVGQRLAPPVPSDSLADAVWGRETMDRSRQVLAMEHGGMRSSRVMIERFEVRPDSEGDAVDFEGEARTGGDINRAVLKLRGAGQSGDLEQAEAQLLWSHAIGPYFDLQAGVRQDFEPRPRRTYAVAGFEGVAPYWFELQGAAFLSNEGELSARLEGSYDLRLTQRLILAPSAEATLSAQDVPELEMGSGLSDIELGLRLRYEIRREFAPYVGVHYERKFGRTADYAEAAGHEPDETRFVAGVRIWF